MHMPRMLLQPPQCRLLRLSPACAQVCKVHLTAAHRDAALKVFGWGPGEAADMLQCAHRVLPDLQALSASHIVPVLGAFVGSSHLGVVTELQPNGDLWSALLSGSMQWGERCGTLVRHRPSGACA